MKTAKLLISVVLILAVFTGCSSDDPPLAPTLGPDAMTGAGSDGIVAKAAPDVTVDSATVVTGSGVFTFDGIVPFECAGEDVHSVVYAPYTWQIVETAKGNYVYTEFWDQKQVTGTLTGMDTGTVWIRTKNVSPYIERDTGGGMAHYTFKSTFVSDTAPTIEVREVFHASRDADGNLRATIEQFNCWMR